LINGDHKIAEFAAEPVAHGLQAGRLIVIYTIIGAGAVINCGSAQSGDRRCPRA
jgi:hypothetical protein